MIVLNSEVFFVVWLPQCITIGYFFLSQVEDKDVELRELKSALANLKDHHDQAQSKVWITNTFIHVCSIVSAPCAAQCWISRWEKVLCSSRVSLVLIFKMAAGPSMRMSTVLIDAVIHFRILNCFLLSIQRSPTERKLYRDFKLNRRIS